MPKSKEVPERFTAHEDPEQMVFIESGEPIPDIMIRLPNGTLVPQSIYGKPPADLNAAQRETWITDRSFQLMSGGDPNWPVDTTGDEE